jgi:hypothetical protein
MNTNRYATGARGGSHWLLGYTHIDGLTCTMLNLPVGSVWGGNASEVRAEYIQGKSTAMRLAPGTQIAQPQPWLPQSVSGRDTPLSSASFPPQRPLTPASRTSQG